MDTVTLRQYDAICTLYRHNFTIEEIAELLSLIPSVVWEVCDGKDAN